MHTASFIGNMNFIPAKVVGEGRELTVLCLSNGETIKSVAATSVAVGTNCVIAIRPERLYVEAGRGFDNTVEATVSDVIFQGNNLLVQTSLADGTLLAARESTFVVMMMSFNGIVVLIGLMTSAPPVVQHDCGVCVIDER